MHAIIINAQRVSLIPVKNLELKTNLIFNSSIYVICSFTTLRFNDILLAPGRYRVFRKCRSKPNICSTKPLYVPFPHLTQQMAREIMQVCHRVL